MPQHQIDRFSSPVLCLHSDPEFPQTITSRRKVYCLQGLLPLLSKNSCRIYDRLGIKSYFLSYNNNSLGNSFYQSIRFLLELEGDHISNVMIYYEAIRFSMVNILPCLY